MRTSFSLCPCPLRSQVPTLRRLRRPWRQDREPVAAASASMVPGGPGMRLVRYESVIGVVSSRLTAVGRNRESDRAKTVEIGSMRRKVGSELRV